MAKRQADRGTNRARRQRRWAVVVAALVVIGAGVGYFAYRAAADLPGMKTADQGNRHVQNGESHEAYSTEPPTSGPHLPYIAPWGVHARPVQPELQVHNLEDGGVVVQYNCECPELAEQLKKVVQGYDKYVILAPYPSMKTRIALTAWTRIDTFDDFDERRIRRFINAYRGIDHHR